MIENENPYMFLSENETLVRKLESIAKNTNTPEFADALNKILLYFKDLGLIIETNPTSKEVSNGMAKQLEDVLDITKTLQNHPDSQAIAGKVYGLSKEGKKMLRKGRDKINAGKETITEAKKLIIEDVSRQAKDVLDEVQSIDLLDDFKK